MGIDPGTAICGVGIIDGDKKTSFKCVYYTCITTESKLTINERLKIIFNELNVLIKKYKPDLISVETLFFNNNPKTAMSVGRASGVILLACELNGIKVIEYTPLQVKVAITGYGRAEKMQMQKMIKILLKLKEIPKPDDAADALSIALCAGVSFV